MRRVKPDLTQNVERPEVYLVDDATNQDDILSVNEAAHEQSQFIVDNGPTDTASTTSLRPAHAPPQVLPPKPSKSKSLLESLLFLGRATKEIEIQGVMFELATLTQKENSLLMKHLYGMGDTADLFTIRALTLVYALKSIGGLSFDDIPLDDPLDEKELKDPFKKKLAIIESMQKNVVEKIHDEYVELVDNSDVVLDDADIGEQLKNS